MLRNSVLALVAIVSGTSLADGAKLDLIGRWKEIRNRKPDVTISRRLELSPTPFGVAELNMNFDEKKGQEGYYEAKFKRTASCTTKYLWVLGRQAGTFDRTNAQTYYDEVRVRLDNAGNLNVVFIDRSQSRSCSITEKEEKFVFRRIDE
jgi:hypothetical protein